MRIGIFGGDTAGRTIDDVVEQAREAEADGFASYSLPQIFALDAMGVLAIVGREVPNIKLATGVVPTYSRHPMTMAQQALTVQAASGGRFMLGIGLSHQMVIENMFGLSFDKPLRHMREYLSVLMPLLHERSVSVKGETISAQAALGVSDVAPPPVLVAALGPKMLELAGKVADGTVTWMTGPATLASHTVPTITAAADAAGRPAPEVFTALADLRNRRSRQGSRARRARLRGVRVSPVVSRHARSGRRGDARRRGDGRRRSDAREGTVSRSPTRASPSSSRRSSVGARNASAHARSSRTRANPADPSAR